MASATYGGEAWQRALDAQLRLLADPLDNAPSFREVSLASVPDFVRMARLGLLTDDSQEGEHDEDSEGTYMERAYVTGWMPPELAELFGALLNLGDKVASFQGYIPVTYSHAPDALAESTWHTALGAHVDGIWRTHPDVEPLRAGMTFVQAFDAVHGRPARQRPDGLHEHILLALQAANDIQSARALCGPPVTALDIHCARMFRPVVTACDEERAVVRRLRTAFAAKWQPKDLEPK
jgi:hypothetical protein